MGKIIFEAFNMSKKIDGYSVLQNMSFRCEEYTALAIRGQNGSGKNILLKILSGIYEPTSGKIGYVPEHFPENLRFKLKEYLLLMAAFRGFSKQQIGCELSEYINLF